MLKQILSKMSHILGFDSSQSLMETHLEYILSRWCDPMSPYIRTKINHHHSMDQDEEEEEEDIDILCNIKHELESFPIELINASLTFPKFLQQYQGIIASVFVSAQNITKLTSMCIYNMFIISFLFHFLFPIIYVPNIA